MSQMVETTKKEKWNKVNPFHLNLHSTFFAIYINMESGWYNRIPDWQLETSFRYNAKDWCWMIIQRVQTFLNYGIVLE